MKKYAHLDSIDTADAEMLTSENAEDLSAWADGKVVEEIDAVNRELVFPGVNIQCRDEVKRASLSDYILRRDSDGSFDVMKQFVFLANYMELKK